MLAVGVSVGLLTAFACAPGEEDGGVVGAPSGSRAGTAAVEQEPTRQAAGQHATTTGAVGIVAASAPVAPGGDAPGGDAPGGPGIPEYEVRKDGTLIIGGDVWVSCRDVGLWSAPASASRSVERQVKSEQREQVEACKKAGFPPRSTSR